MVQLRNDLKSLLMNIFGSNLHIEGHLGGKNYTNSEDIRLFIRINEITTPILLFFRYLYLDNYIPTHTKSDKFNHNIKSDGDVSDEDWTTINTLNNLIIKNEAEFIKLFRKHQYQRIKEDFLDYMMIVGVKAISQYQDKSPFDTDFEN